MNLENKYLRYTSDITEEVFNRISSKLEELGYEDWHKRHGDNSYQFFKDYGHLGCANSVEKHFIYRNLPRKMDEEITVRDILDCKVEGQLADEIPQAEEIKKGDWVIVTERHCTNDPIPGQLVKVIKIDGTSTPYLVEDTKTLHNWTFAERQWCKGVRKATKQELSSSLSKFTEAVKTIVEPAEEKTIEKSIQEITKINFII